MTPHIQIDNVSFFVHTMEVNGICCCLNPNIYQKILCFEDLSRVNDINDIKKFYFLGDLSLK